MPFRPEPRTDECHFLSCSATLPGPFDQSGVAVAGATTCNASKHETEGRCYSLLFFPPLHLHAINPTTSTHKHFVPSPVSFASRDQTGVAVVQSAGNESMNKSCCGIFGQIFSDFSNSANVIITRLRNRINIFL